ncbi:unnamed protein product [Amaranthus hypochondriacus]
MKILGWDPMASMKISCNGTSCSYMRINKRVPTKCCQQGSFILIKQLYWKIRARFKLFWLTTQHRGNAINYSYDAQSYLQNFDNGRNLDHPSPFVP